MTVTNSGASVIGRDVHQVYLASQQAIAASAIATLMSARIRAVWGRSVPAFPVSSSAQVVRSGVELPAAHHSAARSCSKLRFFAISTTVSSSDRQAGDPYSGGGAGRNWSPLVMTQVRQLPASG